MNLEALPQTLKKGVQIGSIGSIVGLIILILTDKNEFSSILFVGLIAMFAYNLLLSTAMIDIGAKRGVILLISLTFVSLFYVSTTIPVIMNMLGQETGMFIELYSYSLYINHIFIMVCIIAFLMDVVGGKNKSVV